MKPVRLSLQALESREAPAADLIVGTLKLDGLGDVAVPGERGKVQVTIQNIGDKASVGKGGIHVDLVTGTFPNLQIARIGKAQNVSLAVGAGGARPFNIPVKIPKVDLYSPWMAAGQYRLQVVVNPNGSVPEDDFGNNRGAGPDVTVAFKFGETGDESENLVGEFHGRDVTFGLGQDDGTGELTIAGGNRDLTLTGTTDTTSLRVSGLTEILSFRNVTVTGSVKTMDMPKVDVQGDFSVSGGLGVLKMHDLGGLPDARLNIGFSAKPANLTFNRIVDADVIVVDGVNKFAAAEWLDNDTQGQYAIDVFSARFVNSFRVNPGRTGLSGDLEAHVRLTGPAAGSTGYVVNEMKVTGTAREGALISSEGGFKKVTLGAADEWSFVAKHMDRLIIQGDWNNVLSLGDAALVVDTAGLIAVEGDLTTGPIQAIGVDPESREAIGTLLIVGEVKILSSLEALQGSIGDILVGDDWEAVTAIRAKGIGKLDVRGKFEANLTLTGPADGPSLKKATIRGALTGVWNVTGEIETFAVVGARGATAPFFRGQVTAGEISFVILHDVDKTGASNFIKAGSILRYIRFEGGAMAQLITVPLSEPDSDADPDTGSFKLIIT